MLVILSDLHFMDTTAGCHNLNPEAFRDFFLDHLAGLIADPDKNIRKVEVLLLGDVFDLLRTQQWFKVNYADRPWGKNGLDDIRSARPGSVTEQQCLKILGTMTQSAPSCPRKKTIVDQNWETFDLLRNLKDRLNKKGEERRKAMLIESGEPKFAEEWSGVDVKLHYIPGNHDRLVRVYPLLRNAVSEILGISGNEPVKTDFECEMCGVFAQHGHEHDQWNFEGLGDSNNRYVQLPVGDIITTEILAKLPWRLEEDSRGTEKDFVERLKDIDNVRPASAAIDWIHYKVQKEGWRELDNCLRETEKVVIRELKVKVPVFADALAHALWRAPRKSRIGWWPWKLLIRLCLMAVPASVLGRKHVLTFLLKRGESRGDPCKDVFAKNAYEENKLKKNSKARHVVYGHTHCPVEVLLDVDKRGGGESYYINTGTWRPRIGKSVKFNKPPDYAKLRHLTCTFFYNSSEDNCNETSNLNSFETWTGVKRKD